MEILTIIGFAVGIIGLAGGGAGYFKSQRGESIIRLQATEIDTLTGIKSRLETEKAAVVAERDRYAEENVTLKELAQGSPQLIKLTAAIEKNSTILQKWITGGARARGSRQKS